jgi:hypothetical protein
MLTSHRLPVRTDPGWREAWAKGAGYIRQHTAGETGRTELRPMVEGFLPYLAWHQKRAEISQEIDTTQFVEMDDRSGIGYDRW